MPRPDIESETKRFQERLESGFFKVDKMSSSEESYSERKLKRDTEAIMNLPKTQIFKTFFEMK
jgi:hypothetical protein